MACSKDYAQVEDIVGGYDFKLVNENKDIILECPICLLLLREAMGTECSHLFCKSCLQRLTSEVDIRNAKFQCPDCQQIVNETLPNAFVNRLVTGSDVYCQQNKTGCPWKGSLASFFEKHNRDCGYKIVKCKNEGCVISCERRNLKDHVLECEYRIVQCAHCTIEAKVIELDRHYSSCVRFPTVCPHDECGSIVPKNEMKEHLNIECPFVVIDCMYSTFGCTEKMTRRDLEKHNQSLMNNHMKLMFNQIVQSKNEIDDLRQENTISRNINNDLRQENMKFRIEIEKSNTKTDNQLDEQRKKIEKQKSEIEELKEQLRNKVDKVTAYSYNIDELLSKGTEKWITKNDVQCFDLSYKNWYTKIFDLMKENKLYRFDSVMYVKIKHEKRNYVYWYSNNKRRQSATESLYTPGDDGLILSGSWCSLVINTETVDDYNHQNKSTSFVIHPQQKEKVIRMEKSDDTKRLSGWCADNIPNDFYIDNFLILCLTKFP